MSWTSFAFTGGKVTVEVHTSRDFQNCLVRPKSYGYSCRRSGSKVRPWKYVINDLRDKKSKNFEFLDSLLFIFLWVCLFYTFEAA